MARGMDNTIGDFQYRVLRAIARLGERATAAEIRAKMAQDSDEPNTGQFYTCANRLQHGGFVQLRAPANGAGNGKSNGKGKVKVKLHKGKPVTRYALTKQGEAAVKAKREQYKALARV
jgi:DNA-binding PadR family transcriptional regulator